MKTVILANGKYPSHKTPLKLLAEAELIVCCDGAAEKLLAHGLRPGAIVGDLDSLTTDLKNTYADILFPDPDQETNDLTKAVRWCISHDMRDIIILGATGLREDHTLANISLLAEYYRDCHAVMYTDTGIFGVVAGMEKIESYPGQQVSLFSIIPDMAVSSEGLRYQLHNLKLKNWWRGTLNEAAGESFSLEFDGCPLIVFREY